MKLFRLNCEYKRGRVNYPNLFRGIGGTATNKQKRGFTPWSEGPFLRTEISLSILARTQRPKIPKQKKLTQQKKKKYTTKETKLKQNNYKTIPKLTKISFMKITPMITICLTTNTSNRVALKLIENNNLIINQIKKERSNQKFLKYLIYNSEFYKT